MKNFVLLFTIWVCWSCHSGDSGDLIVQSEETTDFEVVVDTIRVPTPGTTREFPYYCVSRDYRGTHFAGLDMRTGKINIMDLETFSLTDTITLHPTGPNGIEIFQIGAIYYHNSDSIFILQHIPNRLLIVNGNAEIIWQTDLKELLQQNDSLNEHMAYGMLDQISMKLRKGKVYFSFIKSSGQSDFEVPLMGYYDFDTDDIRTLPIYYPEFYTENEDVGFYDYPGITWLEDEILVVFPHSPEIWVYDYEGQLQRKILGPVEFKIGKTPAPGESDRDHAMNSPKYDIVLPLQGGRYFIQLSRQKSMRNLQDEVIRSTVVYNQDFTQFYKIDKNEAPISFNGDYFYYPIPPEQSAYQVMERYKVVKSEN